MKRGYFDSLAGRWDSLPGPPDLPARISRFAGAVLTGCERRILDVGSGTGVLLSAVRRRAPSACIVECDFAESMLREARVKGATMLVCADAAAPPFAAHAFDLVLCFGLVPHLAEPRAALAALLRCLDSGGRLAIGHAMGSEELNAVHAQIGGPVGQDRLPQAGEMARMLSGLGAVDILAKEGPDHYLVVASVP